MLEAKEREIDGHRVTVTQWPARKALAIKLRLARAVGPGLGELISGIDSKDIGSALDSNIDLSKLVPAIEKLLGGLDESTFMALTDSLMSNVRVDDVEMNNQNNFNEVFTAHLETFYKVIWFVLEVNYGSFFGEGGIGGAVSKIGSLTASSPVPRNSSQKRSGKKN